MARFARIVVPGVAHHVTQRGARKMQVFFSKEDYRAYADILGRLARRHDLVVWAYCLMPNHVHLIGVPSTTEGLARPIGEAHRRYARLINEREGWTGHLWQERFFSFPMDEAHSRAAIRYLLLNPVRAGLAANATDWPYSSARAHALGQPDRLVDVRPAAESVSDWDEYLAPTETVDEATEALIRHAAIGRPLGSQCFVENLERASGRRLRPRRVGRKAKEK